MTPPAASLLRAIVTDAQGRLRPGAVLLGEGPEESGLLLPVSGECLIVRDCREGDPVALEALRARLAQLRRAAAGAHASLLVLGGGAAARAALRAASPWAPGDPLTLFHLDGAGALWCNRVFGRGARLVRPALLHALRRLRAAAAAGTPLPPLGAEEKAALRPAPAQAASDDAAFWSAFAGRRSYATYALGGVILVMFVLEELWGGSLAPRTLLRMGANAPDLLRAGQVWRLLSYAFLHIGPGHLAVNLWSLAVLGPFLERLVGSPRFLLLYGLSALGGGLAIAAFGHGLHPTAGASGALWGLMVAQFVLGLRGGDLLPEGVRAQLRTKGWLPIVANTALSALPGISLSGHLGGGLAGGLVVASGLLSWGLGRLGSPRPQNGPLADRAITIAAALLTAAMAASIVAALVTGQPWHGR